MPGSNGGYSAHFEADMNKLDQLIQMAIEEDLGTGDITARATVPEGLEAAAHIRAKQDLVVAGQETARRVFKAIDPQTKWQGKRNDGDAVKKGEILATVEGKARSLLAGERIALNFLMRLCGIATLARKFSEAVAGTGAIVLDTRKTAPGYRELEKHAAKMGGCVNHRMGLYDSFLIKNNHIVAAGSVEKALELALRERKEGQKVEIEVRTIDQVREAAAGGADIVMLDNMSLEEIRDSVHAIGGRAKVEVSGNVTLANVRAYAEAGADFISVGAITHSAPAADVNMGIEIVK